MRQAKGLLRKYWRFPVIFTPAGAVNVLGSNIAALMIPTLLGLAPAGLYAMAARVSAVPATILGESAGRVFLGEFARATSRSRSLRVFFRWSAALAAMGAGVSIAIWILAPLILPKLLGEGWSGTARLAQFTGVMAGAGIVGSPVQHVWTVRQRGVTQFAWNVIRLAATAVTIWLGAKGDKPITSVGSDLALVTALIYAAAWVGCLWAAARPPAGTRQFGYTEEVPGAS
jgi:O-antigen/teichoic acid export membrane protein